MSAPRVVYTESAVLCRMCGEPLAMGLSPADLDRLVAQPDILAEEIALHHCAN